MERPTAADQLQKIKTYEKGYVAMLLLRTGMELGLFAAINAHGNGVSVPELAEELGLHEPYLYVWCTTAYHYELLDCAPGDRFILQAGLEEVLVQRDSPRNYEGNIKLTMDCMSGDMAAFAGYMRSGEAFTYQERDASFSEAVAESTRNLYAAFKNVIVPRVEGMQEDMERGAEFLEMGCGNGTLMIRLAELYPRCSFRGVDVDRFGIERARRAIGEKELEGRVRVEFLGGEEFPHESLFDYVIMVVVLHEVRPEAREQLAANSYRALKKGGRLVNVDFPYPAAISEFRQIDFERGIFDQYREMIMGHHLQTRPEQEALITGAGFGDLKRFSVGKGMFDVLVAVKGGA